MTAWTLDLILKLLHPIMPFMTEELWEKTAEAGPPRDSMLITAPWPELPDSYADAEAAAEMALVIAADQRGPLGALGAERAAGGPAAAAGDRGRAARAPHPGARTPTAIRQLLRRRRAPLRRVADAGAVPFWPRAPRSPCRSPSSSTSPPRRARLAKEIAALAGDIDRTAKKLANPDFVARAPEEVVEENRERLADAEAAQDRLDAALTRLGAVG